MKILIADDEKLICEWLEFCIKEHSGYEIIGIANNGEQALNLFYEHRPDLILTDIKMPVTDGLSVLKEVKAADPSVLVVLLTAFSEFEYARKAVRENADEYILKTEINSGSLALLLSQMAEKVRRKQETEDQQIQYNGQKHSFIRSLFYQKEPISPAALKKLKSYQIHLRNTGVFAIAMFKSQLKSDFLPPKYEDVHHVVGIEYDHDIYMIAGNLTRTLSEYQKMTALSEYANMILQENQCMLGISSISEHLALINQNAAEAVSGLRQGFYEGKIKLYPFKAKTAPAADIENLKLKQFSQEFYQNSSKNRIALLRHYLDYIETNRPEQIALVKAFAKDCMETIYLHYAIDHMELSKQVLEQKQQLIDRCWRFADLKAAVISYCDDNVWNPEIDETQLSHNVFHALSYIRKHYNEPLSLEQIAREINLNPEYLSRVFKEETGQTYSTFLTNIRMAQAENLLKNSTEKIQHIAEAVGYFNVSYFSTLFKKRYGLNPYEFRRRRE